MPDIKNHAIEKEAGCLTIDKTLQREINLAKNIQVQLLNGKEPILEGAEISGISIPARQVGGDYFDFYSLESGKIRIVIGDVMGKGIPAAMLMILTRGAFRSASENTRNPGEALTAINTALYEDLRTLKSFVTLFCADWDPKTGCLTYANAGHHLPLCINGNRNAVKELTKVSGVMIGGLPKQVYKEAFCQLEESDLVFFYTDGIIEAKNKNGEQYNRNRLVETLFQNINRNVKNIENAVIKSVENFTENSEQRDDITMVLMKKK